MLDVLLARVAPGRARSGMPIARAFLLGWLGFAIGCAGDTPIDASVCGIDATVVIDGTIDAVGVIDGQTDASLIDGTIDAMSAPADAGLQACGVGVTCQAGYCCSLTWQCIPAPDAACGPSAAPSAR